ncbi:MAG: multidrug efflux SMR transporter [Cytophagales bacterium]|nr:multidrug efflux SMR transporter [Cytophagales bacterium]
MHYWLYLFIAGCFEIGFTTFLKMSDNLTRIGPTITFCILGLFSLGFLSKSLEGIDLGTAYAVWTGMGAVGTILMSIFFFKEDVGPWKLILLSVIFLCVIGLRILSAKSA